MSEADLVKSALGLAGVLLGWLLAQLTTSFKTWRERHIVRTLLLAELGDLDAQLERLTHHYARQLQMVGAGVVGNEVPVALANPIYRHYYKVALLSLRQSQRLSYQLVHAGVEQINWGISHLRDKALAITTKKDERGRIDEPLARECAAWGQLVKGQFISCRMLEWQLRYHLDNAANPDTSPQSPGLPAYRAHVAKVSAQADEWIANGKTIDKAHFEGFPKTTEEPNDQKPGPPAGEN